MKRRIINSLVRTVIAICLLVVGIAGLFIGGAWPAWCPNNSLGIILVLMIYLISLILIMYGIYQISPIFWKKLEPVIFERGFNIKTDWEAYTKEMAQLTEFYLW